MLERHLVQHGNTTTHAHAEEQLRSENVKHTFIPEKINQLSGVTDNIKPPLQTQVLGPKPKHASVKLWAPRVPASPPPSHHNAGVRRAMCPSPSANEERPCGRSSPVVKVTDWRVMSSNPVPLKPALQRRTMHRGSNVLLLVWRGS
ncbi:hypothetical protein TNCV_1111421 [Trichonephila clavipes]|nr:hypothetical protein TNCV_1111421 [Trichonephila clavipes]